MIRIRNAKWFFGSRVGGERTERRGRRGGKGEKVTEHRTCRSGVAECITSRDGIHLWKEGKGPYPIVIHWTRRCYEWMDKSMAHRICTFSLPIKQTNNLFYVVSSLTFPRIWRRFFCGVLLVSLLSLSVIWGWWGIWRWFWARNTDYRRRGVLHSFPLIR